MYSISELFYTNPRLARIKQSTVAPQQAASGGSDHPSSHIALHSILQSAKTTKPKPGQSVRPSSQTRERKET